MGKTPRKQGHQRLHHWGGRPPLVLSICKSRSVVLLRQHSCVGWRQVNFAKTGLLSLLAEQTDVDIFFADLDWDLQRNPFPEMRALGVDLAYYKDATWVREPACDQGAYHS